MILMISGLFSTPNVRPTSETWAANSGSSVNHTFSDLAACCTPQNVRLGVCLGNYLGGDSIHILEARLFRLSPGAHGGALVREAEQAERRRLLALAVDQWSIAVSAGAAGHVAESGWSAVDHSDLRRWKRATAETVRSRASACRFSSSASWRVRSTCRSMVFVFFWRNPKGISALPRAPADPSRTMNWREMLLLAARRAPSAR